MLNRSIRTSLTASLTSFGRGPTHASLNGRRLIMAAAVLHFGLALGQFWVARAQLVPSLIDSDGIIESFAFDSHGYQRSATRLVGVLRHEGVIAWVSEPEPIHVKLLALEFALFAPVFGYSTLSAEPLNLCCYLVVVFLILTL